MSKFTYIELFSGIGGFRSGLDSLGGKCVFASEIDKYAAKVYETLYGDVPHGDITQIKSSEIPNHDILTAGFPCPSFSVAGKRNGMDYKCKDCGHEHLITYDEYKKIPKCPQCKGTTEPKDPRGVLFFEIARVAEDIQPKVLLLENVKGLIGHNKGKTLETMVKTLCEIGYIVDYNVHNSKYFGVPQNRERIFIIAIREDLIEPEQWVIEGNNVLAKSKKKIGQIEGIKTFNFNWPIEREVTTRLRDVLEENVDEKYYISEDRTKKLIEQLHKKNNELKNNSDLKFVGGVSEETNWLDDGKNLSRNYKQGSRVYDSEGIATTLTSQGVGGLGGHTGLYLIDESSPCLKRIGYIDKPSQGNVVYDSNGISATIAAQTGGLGGSGGGVYTVDSPVMLGLLDIKGHESVRRVYSTDGISPTLTTMGGGNREPKIAEIANPENLSYCIDANYAKGISPGGIGKGRRTHVMEEVRPVLTPEREEKRQNGRRFKDNDEEAFTLTAQDKHGVAIGSYPIYRIRKLTPLECWRLQGFTDEQFYKVRNAGISDTQLYKMAGNAVTVNVIKAIGENLVTYIK